jgi:hypothetical protein
LKRLAALLAVLGFLAGTLVEAVPQSAAAQPCGMTTATSSPDAGHGAKCAVPACDEMGGCIVSVALPSLSAPIFVELAWTSVRYWASSEFLDGLSVQPDHSPPIANS